MLQINDHVYNTKVNANGVIVDIDETKRMDKYKVEFFWAKYADTKHGSFTKFKNPERKWQWSRDANLVLVFRPGVQEEINKVTSIGHRSLDNLVRRVCGIDKRILGDRSDIIITLGQSNHRLADYSKRLVLNETLVINKYLQCQFMQNLAPISLPYDPNKDHGWIQKPYFSFAGRNIHPLEDDSDFNEETHYAQLKFSKDREFRAHCFLWHDTYVPLIQEKIPENSDSLCWNRHQGAVIKTVWQNETSCFKLDPDLYLRIRELSVEALKRLEHDYGGVDLAIDQDGNMKIFEVNSRMGMRERALLTYKNMFHELKFLDIQTYKQERW